MANEIVYDSNELEGMIGKLSESVALLEAASSSVANNFTVLKELELSNVSEEIQKDIDNIADSKRQLINKLRGHNEDVVANEDSLTKVVNDESNYNRTSGGGGGGGGNTEPNPPDTNPNAEITKITELDLDGQKRIVANLIKANPLDLNRVLFGMKNTKALIHYLKAEAPNLNFSTEDNFAIQKQFLQLLADNKDETFFKDNKTFLVAKVYLESVAKANKMTFSELLIDDKNKTLLYKTFKNLYYSKEIPNGLTNKEMSIYRNYLENIAKKLNIKVETLLNNEIYIDVVKQGV